MSENDPVRRTRTVFTDLEELGHDEDFSPVPAAESTSAAPGSQVKIELMRLRVELGQDLYHPMDDKTPPEPGDKTPTYRAGIRGILMMKMRKKLN